MNNFVSNPEIQAQIERAITTLRAMTVGQVAPYELFPTRYALMRAREIVEKEDGVRFGTVHKIGVKRLAAEDVPAIGVSGIRRLHRVSRKTVKRLSNLRSYNDMTPTDRLRVAAQRMVANAVAEKTARAAVKEAEDSVRTAGAAIDFGTVLK